MQLINNAWTFSYSFLVFILNLLKLSRKMLLRRRSIDWIHHCVRNLRQVSYSLDRWGQAELRLLLCSEILIWDWMLLFFNLCLNINKRSSYYILLCTASSSFNSSLNLSSHCWLGITIATRLKNFLVIGLRNRRKLWRCLRTLKVVDLPMARSHLNWRGKQSLRDLIWLRGIASI